MARAAEKLDTFLLVGNGTMIFRALTFDHDTAGCSCRGSSNSSSPCQSGQSCPRWLETVVDSQKGSISGPDERLPSCHSNHQEVCYSGSCCQWRHFEFNHYHTAFGTRETWWWRHSSLVSGSFAAHIRIAFRDQLS